MPGADAGQWGDILNDYLAQSHNTNGTLKDNVVTSNVIAPNSVTSSAIAPNSVTASSLAPNAVNNTVLADGSVTAASLNIATGATGQVLTLDSAVTSGFKWSTPTIPTIPVTSVAGRIGDIALTKSDVGLTNVDNTSDANKPVSTATQTALNGKANTSHTHAEGDITNLTTDLAAKVTANTAITSATKTKISYDTKGLVTAGADATTADIADSTDKRYVTDAQRTVITNTSGTNTGDQVLPTWATISDKPAVVGAGADAASARAAIGAGTSSLVIGTTAGTAAAGNDARFSATNTAANLFLAINYI